MHAFNSALLFQHFSNVVSAIDAISPLPPIFLFSRIVSRVVDA
jgi:hypothetical protein